MSGPRGTIGRPLAMVVGAALMAVAAARAQAAFDGTYAGTATLIACTGGTNAADRTLQMEVASGRVTVHTVKPDGSPGRILSGTIDPSGKVSASALFMARDRPVYLYQTLSATIKGNDVSGALDVGVICHWDVSMEKR